MSSDNGIFNIPKDKIDDVIESLSQDFSETDLITTNYNLYKKIRNYIKVDTRAIDRDDFDFKNKTEYIKLDLDSQGMLGGQYYGLIYTKESKEKLIIYDEKEETKKGNNVFIRQKIKDNWYFYYEDYDGKVNINKIKK